MNQRPNTEPVESKAKPKEAPVESESHGTRLHWQDLPKNILRDQKGDLHQPVSHRSRECEVVDPPGWLDRGAHLQRIRWFQMRFPMRACYTAPAPGLRGSAPTTRSTQWPSRFISSAKPEITLARDTGRMSIEALADAEITVNIHKAITQRPRPEYQGASVAFFSGGDAWPSWHSIKAWAFARVVAREFPHPVIIPVIAYGLVLLC